jgi:hypothetical protein
VHTLVNGRGHVARGSEAWRRLFADPEIERREEWREGVPGFGLPVADTLWLYGPGIGAFARFDAGAGRPVPQVVDGRDMRDVIDDWLRRGWVDALHTPGPGPITREATAAGLGWLAEQPHRRLSVWVNHSIEKTPSCIEPDRQHALRAVLRNLARAASFVLHVVGLRAIGRRIASTPELRPYPPGKGALLWTLTLLLVASGATLAAGLLAPGRASVPYFAGAGGVLLAVLALLQAMPVAYALGDNPGSPFYNADLVREAGFRFYWFVKAQPGYESHVNDTLALPEEPCGGRPSCLRVAALDDGSRVLVFGRVQKQSPNAWGSFDLLTDQGLADLLAREGTGILYTHWTIYPTYCFTARALDGLRRLQRLHEAKRVWVAPTSEILRFTATRAFLDYEVRETASARVIDLRAVLDPVRGRSRPTLDELRGIAFALGDEKPTELTLAGAPLPPASWRRLNPLGSPVIGFPLDAGGAPGSGVPHGA